MAKKELEDILNGTGGDEPPVDASVAEPEAPASDGRPRDEHGRFASIQETGDTPQEPQGADPAPAAPAAEPPAQMVPLAALEDERRKRQEMEMRFQMMEQQYRQPPQAEPESPDFWEDPRAVMRAETAQAVNQALQQYEARQAQERAEQAEIAARQKYPDYDDAFARFHDQIAFDPSLIQQLHRSSDPAEFAYQRGKQALEIAKYGGVDQMIEAKKAEWEAGLRAQSPVGSPLPPTTTASQRSVGQRTGPAWAGPVNLEDLFG